MWREVFPDIKSEDYYDHLNFKDGQGWIDENMITIIIKDILNRMTVTDGTIKYAYKQVDNQNVIISLYWENNERKSFVSYKIAINKL
ncbi:MHO_1590 family protein [Mycoplasma phocoeninasale]